MFRQALAESEAWTPTLAPWTLPTSFVDPSARLLPPCAARTERTGSLMVQNREALPRSLDAPLPSTLGGAAGVGNSSPASGSIDCSVFQERS